MLVHEKLNSVVIHIGSNDITKFNYNNVNAEELGRLYGVINIAVSFILKHLCKLNNFFYICIDLLNEKVLWKADLHVTNEGSFLFLNNFINYLNEKVNKNIWIINKGYDIEKK